MGSRHIMRFYYKIPEKSSKVSIIGEEARHINVFRLKKGDKIELFDGKEYEAKGIIDEIGKDKVVVNIVSREEVSTRPYFITLATAVPKGKRLDWLIQKATELGADKIIQIVSSRSIIKPKSSHRAEKIVAEACKQCGRGLIPAITEPIKLPDLDTGDYDLKLAGVPGGEKIKELLRGKKPKKIICLVGPEGGFTDEEKEVIKKKGFISADLGKETLRIETAGIYLLSAVKYELSDYI